MKTNNFNDLNRSISHVFAAPTFRKVFETGYCPSFVERIQNFKSKIGARKNASVGCVLSKAYNHLTENYRNEYVYKNIIANKLLIERHNLNNAVLINEMKVGNSIADITVINGTNTIYEIKTELDSPDKLYKQMADYRCVSDKVFVVTHHSLVDKYRQLLKGYSVGLISLTGCNELELIIDAPTISNYFDNNMMMNVLRKDEYSSIISKWFGGLPKVSNIHYYRECNKLINDIDPVVFHGLMVTQLKSRLFREKKLLSSKLTPFELKQICIARNPTQKEFNNLYKFLNQTL